MILNACHKTYEYFYIILYFFSFLFDLLRVSVEMTFAALCGTLKVQKKRWARKCKHLRFVSMPNAFYIGPRKRDEFDCIKWKQNAWETKRNLCLMFLSHNMLSPWRTCYAYLCVRVSVNKISLFTYINVRVKILSLFTSVRANWVANSIYSEYIFLLLLVGKMAAASSGVILFLKVIIIGKIVLLKLKLSVSIFPNVFSIFLD